MGYYRRLGGYSLRVLVKNEISKINASCCNGNWQSIYSFAADNAGNLSEISTHVPESGQIHATQTILLNTTNGANISSFLFVLTWLNATSNLEAALIAPSGAKIDSTTQLPVIYGVNKSLIFYIIPNAEIENGLRW
jgi:hypothetical protein